MNTTVKKENMSSEQENEKLFEAIDVLQQLCGVKNYKGSRTGTLNLTPRASFITAVLEYMELEYEIESFVDPREKNGNVAVIFEEVFKAYENLNFVERSKVELKMEEEDGEYSLKFDLENLQEQGLVKDLVPTYNNIVVKFDASVPTEESIIFTAHHDIVNPASDNCQDNSASVANLLDLARRLVEEQPELNKNVYIIFLDCEETGGRGAGYNADKIREGKYGDVKFIANSELTALGESIWMERVGNSRVTPYVEKIEEMYPDITLKRCPPSDAGYYRSYGIQQAVCFGILPEAEKDAGYPSAWAVCHSTADVFKADAEEMKNYVDFLFSLINVEV